MTTERADLSRTQRTRTIDQLDLDVVTAQSMENPVYYVQYAHARISSILRHAAQRGLEVDGGVKVDNIREIAAAGADTFVAGSAIFGKPDYRAVIDAMRAELLKL